MNKTEPPSTMDHHHESSFTRDDTLGMNDDQGTAMNNAFYNNVSKAGPPRLTTTGSDLYRVSREPLEKQGMSTNHHHQPCPCMCLCVVGCLCEVCFGQLSRPVDRSLEVDKRLRAVCMGTSPIQEASYRGRPLFGGETDEYMIFGRIGATGLFIRFLFGLREVTGVTVLSSTVPLALLELALRVPNSSALCHHRLHHGCTTADFITAAPRHITTLTFLIVMKIIVCSFGLLKASFGVNLLFVAISSRSGHPGLRVGFGSGSGRVLPGPDLSGPSNLDPYRYL
uniref:Uncharacterized protein n=1 Tax=Brassica oleracea TaxID=3712 RepID=A0A3P6CBA4_BRAOL|nr:unnamed protein product [Brassica oleracea]